MKIAYLVIAGLVALPVAAQTVSDDTPSIENWWDKVGSGFFSDVTLLTPRPEYEIRAHWTGLSDDDRAAVLSRCAALQGDTSPPVSTQEGDKDEDPHATSAELADGATSDETNQLTNKQSTTVQNDATSGSADASDSTTATGSVAGLEVQKASPSQTPEPDTGLAGASGGPEDARTIRVCNLVKDL